MGYKRGQIDFDDLQAERDFDHRRSYYQTRLALVLFTFALARRLAGSGITVNVLHPGIVKTNLSHNYMANPVFRFFEQIVAVTPEKGAEPSLYLATSPDVANVTGEYFKKQQVEPATDTARNQALQERMWEVSEALTGQHEPLAVTV